MPRAQIRAPEAGTHRGRRKRFSHTGTVRIRALLHGCPNHVAFSAHLLLTRWRVGCQLLPHDHVIECHQTPDEGCSDTQ